MQSDLESLKGIHPGIIVGNELQKRDLRKNEFADMIDEYPQTLGAIIKGQRKMNIPLSLKIERALNLKEGYLMTLQVFHDINKIKQNEGIKIQPNLNRIRTAVFWDTDINSIDWEEQKEAVIQRIFERGNKKEIIEIIDFYGKQTVLKIINKKLKISPRIEENKNKFLDVN